MLLTVFFIFCVFMPSTPYCEMATPSGLIIGSTWKQTSCSIWSPAFLRSRRSFIWRMTTGVTIYSRPCMVAITRIFLEAEGFPMTACQSSRPSGDCPMEPQSKPEMLFRLFRSAVSWS